MGLKAFTMGGIHPPENKTAKDSPIEVLSVPEKVSIPLAQHIGAPARPVVKKGDIVKVGTLIASPGGFISTCIHSSVSGKVAKIEDVNDVSGYKRPAVTIAVEGDEWEDSIDRSEDIVREISYAGEEIVEKIKDAGIVGLGGAAFPSHVKYLVPEGKVVDTLIINGVECEPYLTADHRIMLERSEEIFIGVEILKKALGVKRAFIGIENNKPDAIEKMEKIAKDYPGTEVTALRVQFPQGAEKQLIKAIVNREVPGGKLPLDVGCVVNNVGTALSVYYAIQKNKPLIDRVVTVTGKSLSKRANFLARIGTPYSFLIDAVGGVPEGTGKIISGGPMMGKAVGFTDIPITKGTSGIVFLDEDESKRPTPSNCIRCGKCVSVCPMGLSPYFLEKVARRKLWDECEDWEIVDCIECGSCSYTCPASRPLTDYIRYGKANVMRIMRERSAK